MEWFKSGFDFIRFTLADSGSKIIYTSSGAAASSSKMIGVADGQALDWLLPYVPLMAVGIAFLKLVFDFFKWWLGREQRATEKVCNKT